ncbi:hypothetical protein DFH09DRAFT_1068767 [Mycena vulgaris]|nr:hypothetical protein DFH09DRAFT_1068767 [Mycena vulgaris]
MNYTVETTIFSSYWAEAVFGLWAICVEILLYGILLVLLSIAAHSLHRWTGAGCRIFRVAIFVMAILATVQLVIHAWITVLGLQVLHSIIEGLKPDSGKLFQGLYTASDFLLVTNKLWGCKIWVVIFPLLMLLATTVVGYVLAYADGGLLSPYFDTRISCAMALITNIVLMGLSAGRIWWVRGDACVIFKLEHVRRYDTAIAIIILLYLISFSVLKPYSTVTSIFEGSIPQMMNIAPTLMIVRVWYGRSVRPLPVAGGPRVPRRQQPVTHVDVATSAGPSFVINVGVGNDRTGKMKTGWKIKIKGGTLKVYCHPSATPRWRAALLPSRVGKLKIGAIRGGFFERFCKSVKGGTSDIASGTYPERPGLQQRARGSLLVCSDAKRRVFERN